MLLQPGIGARTPLKSSAGRFQEGDGVHQDGALLRHFPAQGLITLLNADGLRVDGVSYIRGQTQNPGYSVKF